ncbi:LOW QUALITY PROTEIN: vesicular inhibitory amino acid transporter-like [Macrobrachium rosenbergii]|uniref:LOW QUALITY PROTEIN: vesicular inhibitory amino acid transporter-like n=1 Tax=Macrobrachium rosenbergii TaxID=79674 RepID=UPI0034D74213
MPFPLPFLSAAKETASTVWTGVKGAMPESCLGGPDERLNFAKFGRNRGDVEMTAVNKPEGGGEPGEGGESSPKGWGQPPLQREGSVGSMSTTVGVEGSDHDMITEWQAGWNVTNAIQGMFIVSLPYAVLHGGYWAIVAMIGIAYICCYTGKILVDCLYDLNEEGQLVRVRHSYKGIAKEVFGQKWGGKIVNSAQLIELLMTCILYIVLCGDLMIGSFPDGPIDTRSWMMICGIILLPCGFLKNLHHVSTLSFWCMIAHLAINIIIFAYCIGNAPTWAWSKVMFRIDILEFPIALGIIVFSYTSHIFLPTLEYNLIDRSKFTCMLNWSHISAALFKSLFGYVGFLTWAEDTEEVITNNLPNPTFKGFVNLILVVKALLSYPLPYYAACEIIEVTFFRGRPKTVFPSVWALDGELKVWALGIRVIVVVFTILMAISIPHFAILMGLIGSFTGTMLSFIWPCYFHLKIKAGKLEWGDIAYDWFVIFLGFLFGIIGITTSFYALVEAFQIGLPF